MAAVNGLPPSNLVSEGSFFSLRILNRSQPMFPYSLAFFFSFLFAFSLSFSLCVFFLCKRIYKLKRPEQTPSDPSFVDQHLYRLINGANDTGQDYPTPLTHSLLLDILPSNFYGWQTLFENGPCRPGSGDDDKREGFGGDALRVKKKKKRAKKKRLGLKSDQENVGGGEKDGEERKEDGSAFEPGRAKPDLVCCYPFTSTSSATQRKIKQHYDQLVKSNESNGLTLAQVGEFVNCLIEARNELQHKSEVIKRKFTITKVLLLKADRSSVDRYRQQIYKLELEQKRLEEDAFVYNWLQQQLKLSPAYKQIVEISDSTELKAKSGELIKNKDAEVSDISFEELLAQEKKDAFWQKHGRSRTCSS